MIAKKPTSLCYHSSLLIDIIYQSFSIQRFNYIFIRILGSKTVDQIQWYIKIYYDLD